MFYLVYASLKAAVPYWAGMQPMEGHGGAAHGRSLAAAGGCALKDTVACGKSTLKQAPGWNCGQWRGASAREDFVAKTVACMESRLQQPAPEGLYPVGGNPHWNWRTV